MVLLAEWLIPEADLRSDLPPCFEVGAPFHHRYRPLCQGELESPRGPLPFATNEDGLRELPRAEVLSHPRRVLLLGDSFVEGWWMRREEGLAAELSRLVPGRYFINAGLRSTGPLFQAYALPSLLETYRPESVLLLLNETDYYDDRLACALSQGEGKGFSTADFEPASWERALIELLGESKLGRKVKVGLYRRRWRRLTGLHPDGCRCQGLKQVQQLAGKANIPLEAVFLPLREGRESGPYTVEAEARQALLACLKESGTPYNLLTLEGAGLSGQDFWPGDIHLNPEGNRRLAAAIAARLGPKAAGQR